MSRVRFMSPYLKGGQNAAKLSNRVRYIAARPGVEVLSDEQRDLPATKSRKPISSVSSGTSPVRRSCWSMKTTGRNRPEAMQITLSNKPVRTSWSL